MFECKRICIDFCGLVWIYDREKEEERENYICFGKTADSINTIRCYLVDCRGNRFFRYEG